MVGEAVDGDGAVVGDEWVGDFELAGAGNRYADGDVAGFFAVEVVGDVWWVGSWAERISLVAVVGYVVVNCVVESGYVFRGVLYCGIAGFEIIVVIEDCLSGVIADVHSVPWWVEGPELLHCLRLVPATCGTVSGEFEQSAITCVGDVHCGFVEDGEALGVGRGGVYACLV